ncbi:NADP-dependent oxidoreductase [Aquimarina macrocephali]|uniref:NADP-dependent oxidoreductase n=1 Tax=Aquimarina macrocephali TaxID=666563 RepID=UPI0004633E30|nr:NADP-dependent oxidoreductase [Aquimarina macrocephali]
MKAIIANKKGIENIEIREIDIPKIRQNEVLIKIKAIGVNPVDWKGVESGEFGSSYILGSDISGIVEGIGNKVTKFKKGDEVIGSLDWNKQGAYAEFVASEERFLTTKPKNLTFIEAAAIPMASLTAWQGIFDKLGLSKNEKIVIQATAGGVGLFALQFAKWAGAFVIAIASEKNTAFLKSLGADMVLDYNKIDFSETLENIDAVFDSVETAEESFKILKKDGKYVGISSLSTPISKKLIAQYDVTATKYLFKSNNKQLKEIVMLIENSDIKIFIDKVFSFSEVKKALKYQKNGHSRGKNIIVPD